MITRMSVMTAVHMGSTSTSVFRGEGIPEDPSDKVKNGHHSIGTYKDAEVCLTCTKSECHGGEDCFRNRKRKMKGGG